jgi:hypothetical protein
VLFISNGPGNDHRNPALLTETGVILEGSPLERKVDAFLMFAFNL